ncbi:MAG: hypothetical protein HYS04_06025 [Acidobacteria bacterium]|nr:hypothetical protein [Acidobacteriota bacterium]
MRVERNHEIRRFVPGEPKERTRFFSHRIEPFIVHQIDAGIIEVSTQTAND